MTEYVRENIYVILHFEANLAEISLILVTATISAIYGRHLSLPAVVFLLLCTSEDTLKLH